MTRREIDRGRPYCIISWGIDGGCDDQLFCESLDEALHVIDVFVAEERVQAYEDACLRGKRMDWAPCAQIVLMTDWDDELDDWDYTYYDELCYVELRVTDDDLRCHLLRRVYDVDVMTDDDGAAPIMTVEVDSPCWGAGVTDGIAYRDE